MASTYALPASAMTQTHSHHGHSHSASHSHSHSHSQPPSKQYSANSPRLVQHEKSTGRLDSLSVSGSRGPHHDHDHVHEHSNSPLYGHSPIPSPSGYLPTPPNSTGLSPANFEKHIHESPSLLSSSDPLLSDELTSHKHDSCGHAHSHASPIIEPRSKFTCFLLPLVSQSPLLHTILADKDSRRIFYFMSLNFAFMIVQAAYGFITDSLGLLSDSIHMFFDCLALAVGLFAAVASKWPPSERFPYGFGKIESLSGFGNGVFLMLISIEIIIEATERLADGRETKRLLELFVVSAMGLAVNLVGMACFGHHGHHHGHDHGHEGHDHGHSHSHSHSHSQEKSHSHTGKPSDSHNHDNNPETTHSHTTHSHASHSHSHENENMHGIFLHILADTMGSAAVMVSTALIYFVGWNGWDPLASCVIAILIFLSSIPLIKSSARKLLLTVPDDVEYNLRNTLAGLSNIRGVGMYTVPRFWIGDTAAEGDNGHILGVVHIIATRGSDLEDVKERARQFLMSHEMNIVVQVEASGEVGCWCGGNSGKSPRRIS